MRVCCSAFQVRRRDEYSEGNALYRVEVDCAAQPDWVIAGLEFPPLKERFERLEEALLIAKKMWSGDVSPYNGKHYHLAEPINSPQPLTQPHPPILIGGSGERKTLRLVAQYADACNLFAFGGNGLPRRSWIY